ncbi:YtpI family protein [Gracilibacillus salinarum]|uniref:YtpI family protein n=1 Tax=Gracilibacillus salinarum TaxID=2932255 RepID=A0ABY4GQ21_9BACI|nr:YtpI family protein [Gracilibacillus salinarum]UOQ86281.1 YtpI family protein [Gracilibacillus salinarum]
MVVFPIIIIVSFFMYFYYKIMILRDRDPLQQEIKNAKARIALGVCISFFGINQYLFYQTRLALFITIVFLFFGVLQGTGGVKRWIHYKGEFEKRATSE